MGAILVKAGALVLIIIAGYVIKRLGWVSGSDFPKFSKIVLRLTLPCALITAFNGFVIEHGLLFLIPIGFAINVLEQWVGSLINRKKGAKERAFGILNIGSYNVGAFAMPYISGFVGQQSMIIASIFDIGNSLGAAGIGYGWAISTAGESEKGRINIGRFLLNMVKSPVFDTHLFVLFMGLTGLRLPAEILAVTSTVGSANTFLVMLMIGIGLELNLGLDKFKKALRYLRLRYGFSILFALLVFFYAPFSNEVKAVLCMLFFSPYASMIVGFVGEFDGDVETSAFMTSLSILVGIIAMPVILLILG